MSTIQAERSYKIDPVYQAIFWPDVADILRAFHIKRAYLFGSYARREQTPESDIDLLVEREIPFWLLSYMGLKEALEDTLGTSVDLVPRENVKHFAREEIEREKILILDATNA